MAGTISWLIKRRSLRTRRAKKVNSWLAFVQLASAHILVNLADSGRDLKLRRGHV
jgi:hypothetical protein